MYVSRNLQVVLCATGTFVERSRPQSDPILVEEWDVEFEASPNRPGSRPDIFSANPRPSNRIASPERFNSPTRYIAQ